ncbi:hypothetical protein D3C71_1853460 [compost metagenome]
MIAISPGCPSVVTSWPSSSSNFRRVLGSGTPMVPVYSVAVMGLQLTVGLVSDNP